ncbi:MAG TPA: extracellular solute-binding protein [Candidatus Sulfotelmatobacter sp.]|nr:extracellular solute-binding protein [Candidatus Sulfotelmatobacter sp.]
MNRIWLAGLGALALTAAGAAPGRAADQTTIIALVSAVGNAAMREVAAMYERVHPDVHVQIVPGGAAVLVAQVEAGSGGDLITGGPEALAPLVTHHKIGSGVGIFSFHEVVLVRHGSTKVHSLRDLANPGMRLALGTTNSTIAAYSNEVLRKAAEQYGADFPKKVMANVIVTESTSTEIAAAVRSGLVEAAIGFSSDASDGVDAINVPAADDVITVDQVAPVNGSPHADAVAAFSTYLRGPEAQAAFRKHHLDAPH